MSSRTSLTLHFNIELETTFTFQVTVMFGLRFLTFRAFFDFFDFFNIFDFL